MFADGVSRLNPEDLPPRGLFPRLKPVSIPLRADLHDLSRIAVGDWRAERLLAKWSAVST
jgi:hypothetical protein